MVRDTRIVPVLSFSTRIGTVPPASAMSNGTRQLFGSAAVDTAARVGDARAVVTRVGTDVKVGNEVGVGVDVGGSGVAVGMAACVWATIVHAAATAVPCTSAGFIVGVACGPHAVKSTTSARRTGIDRFNICVSICFVLFA
jgi:hypothetical protein